MHNGQINRKAILDRRRRKSSRVRRTPIKKPLPAIFPLHNEDGVYGIGYTCEPPMLAAVDDSKGLVTCTMWLTCYCLRKNRVMT